MANGLRQNSTWRDAVGNTVRTSFFVASSGTAITQRAAASAVLSAIENITNATLSSTSGPETDAPFTQGYGTAAQFLEVEDKVVMSFAASDSTIHRYQIPAPKIAIFEVDQKTVDAAQTDAAAYITATLGNAVTLSGEALSSFLGGVRIRRKLHRKLSIYTKVPELDEPAE